MRILVLGIFASGKTSLVRALRGHDFCHDLDSTCGVSYNTATTRLLTTTLDAQDASPLLEDVDDTELFRQSAAMCARDILAVEPGEENLEAGASSAATAAPPQPETAADRHTDMSDSLQAQPADTLGHSDIDPSDELQVRSRSAVANKDRHADDKSKKIQAWITDIQQRIPLLSSDAVLEMRDSLKKEASKQVYVETLDCGGQLSFSTAQSFCLESSNPVFLLTTDCTKDLHAKVEKTEFRDPKTGKTVVVEQLSADYTYLDYIQMWVSSVAHLARTQTGMPSPLKKSNEAIKPLIILVATHFDLVPPEKRNKTKVEMQRILHDEVISHIKVQGVLRVDGPYFVDNRALGSDQGIGASELDRVQFALSEEIRRLAQPEKVPLRWMNMERLLKLLPEKISNFSGTLSVKQIHVLFSSPLVSSRMEPPSHNELRALLLYLDWRGTIKLPGTEQEAGRGLGDDTEVFVDMQWLLSKMAAVTTSSLRRATNHPTDLYNDVAALEQDAKLTSRLLDHLWADQTPNVRKEIMRIMQGLQLAFCTKLNLPPSADPSHASYIIPSCLSADREHMEELGDDFHSLPPVQLLTEHGLFPIALYHRVVVSILECLEPEDFQMDFNKLRLQLDTGSLPRCGDVTSMYFEVQHVSRGVQLAIHCQCDFPEKACEKNMSDAGVAFRVLVEDRLSILQGKTTNDAGFKLAFCCKKTRRHSLLFKLGRRSGFDSRNALTQKEADIAKGRIYTCGSCAPKAGQRLPSRWLLWLPQLAIALVSYRLLCLSSTTFFHLRCCFYLKASPVLHTPGTGWYNHYS